MRDSLAPLILVLAVAFAASPIWVPDFGGFDPDAFPVPQDRPAVQPAGYAFAIWGVIYLWLIVSAIYGVWRKRADPAWHRMRPALAVSLGVGAVWLPVAVLSPIWASVLIWAMLIPALFAVFHAPRAEPWAALWPLGLYAGWLSAAACVSIGLLLGGYAVLGEKTAALLMITVAAVLAFVVQWRLVGAPTYGGAVIWAFTAITLQNGTASTVGLLALGAAVSMLGPMIRSARGL